MQRRAYAAARRPQVDLAEPGTTGDAGPVDERPPGQDRTEPPLAERGDQPPVGRVQDRLLRVPLVIGDDSGEQRFAVRARDRRGDAEVVGRPYDMPVPQVVRDGAVEGPAAQVRAARQQPRRIASGYAVAPQPGQPAAGGVVDGDVARLADVLAYLEPAVEQADRDVAQPQPAQRRPGAREQVETAYAPVRPHHHDGGLAAAF